MLLVRKHYLDAKTLLYVNGEKKKKKKTVSSMQDSLCVNSLQRCYHITDCGQNGKESQGYHSKLISYRGDSVIWVLLARLNFMSIQFHFDHERTIN